MGYIDRDEQPEHECPTPLERAVSEFRIGGVFWSPAGRWEVVKDHSDRSATSPQASIWTDKTGPDYAWAFWRSTKMPYLPDHEATRRRFVVVRESRDFIEVRVDESTRGFFGAGHTLLSAQAVRGSGWKVTDRPGGGAGDVEVVAVPSKARARTEVNRRARAHAKKLGLAVSLPEGGDSRG
jgi:hypothetical protein